jgi:hypothetical protein
MSKLRLSGATSGYEEIKTADAGDNNTYQVGSTVTAVNVTASGTIQDAQGNVRVLNRNSVDSTPYALPSGSSGKYFVAFGSASTITIDSGNCETGQIITIFNFLNTDITISWTNMTNGVYIAGDTTNQGTSGSVTLAGKGLVTILNDTADRLIFNGNVS